VQADDEFQVQDDMDQGMKKLRYLSVVTQTERWVQLLISLHSGQYLLIYDTDVNLLAIQNENLRLQIALKTKELQLEESRRVKLELILKTNENESLLKQNEELKAENEQLKKTVSFLCRYVHWNHAV
jgi:hypothetical protein